MLYESEGGDISIALTGDSLITRPVSMFQESGFLELVQVLRDADVTVSNAEMLFHRYEDPPSAVPGGSYMQADPSILDELKWMGIDMVAAANNHNYDYGENGLMTHLRNLQSSPLVHAGIGANLGEAREPRYLDTPNGRVAIVSATSSGPPGMLAAHQWRDGRGRPGTNMLRYTTHYTVKPDLFEALRQFRDEFGLRAATRGGTESDHSWGLSKIPDSEFEFYMRDLHDRGQYPVPNGYRFVRGKAYGRRLIANEMDLEENLQRIRDAKRQADWVIVTMHNHESGMTLDDPPDFVVTFSHAAIDAGADVFHGHGPHRDRGIEIYKGRPIFYSLGHLIYQNSTIQRMPLENFVRQGLDPWESTPADFYDGRFGDEAAGAWEGSSLDPATHRDAIALVTFSANKLTGVRLRPIDLGFRRPRGQRGRPVFATGSQAQEVLELFQRLSKPFGTDISIENDAGEIAVSQTDKNF